MFSLEAYEVVGFDRKELQATEKAGGLVLSFVHWWSVGVFSFPEQRFDFEKKPAFMFPQLFVDFSREKVQSSWLYGYSHDLWV